MNMAEIMDAIAGAAPSVAGPGFGWPVETVVPPAFVVGFPTTIDYDVTYGRGADRMVIPAWAVTGRVADKTARDRLSVLVSSATEIKASIETNATLLTKADTVRVTGATPAELVVGGVPLLSMKFDIEVIA